MREISLYKTIEGTDCEIYAVQRNRRIYVGKAEPKIEVYQEIKSFKTAGGGLVKHKTYHFSVVICTDAEVDETVLVDALAFDLALRLRRADGVIVPYNLYALDHVDIDGATWRFEIKDDKATRELIVL